MFPTIQILRSGSFLFLPEQNSGYALTENGALSLGWLQSLNAVPLSSWSTIELFIPTHISAKLLPSSPHRCPCPPPQTIAPSNRVLNAFLLSFDVAAYDFDTIANVHPIICRGHLPCTSPLATTHNQPTALSQLFNNCNTANNPIGGQHHYLLPQYPVEVQGTIPCLHVVRIKSTVLT